MTEQQIASSIGQVLVSGGAGAALLIVSAKWVLGQFFKQRDVIEKLQQEKVDQAISNLRHTISELKEDLAGFRGRINEHETKLISAVLKIQDKADDVMKVAKALPGYIDNTNARLEKIEQAHSQVVELSRNLIMITQKKKV